MYKRVDYSWIQIWESLHMKNKGIEEEKNKLTELSMASFTWNFLWVREVGSRDPKTGPFFKSFDMGGKMQSWVQEFLRGKGDQNISKEELDREIQIPVFCYRRLTDFFIHDFDERIKTLFGIFIASLEPEVFYQLQIRPNFYLHNVTKIGEVRRLEPRQPGPIELVVFSRLGEMTDSAVLGTISHEMSHVYLKHSDRLVVGLNLAMENEADCLCKEWGFDFELSKARDFLKTKKGEDEDV